MIGKKTFRVNAELETRVRPSQHRTGLGREEWLCDSMQGDGKGNTEPISNELERGVRFAAEVQGHTGKTELLLDGSGSEKLCGALKDAAWVTPSCDHELNQGAELHDSIYRKRPGQNRAAFE